jgi:hypothetical protein
LIFGSGSGIVGWIPIWIRIHDDQKLRKKITAEKKFDIKNCNTYPWGFIKELSYRRSLQSSKENIQHLKTLNFLTFFYFGGFFLPSWIPNPDPPDPIRILIRNNA